jgi:hypothetical protein
MARKILNREALALARDPSTPAARLYELARSEGSTAELHRCIASNPNAPLQLLQQLSHQFPSEVLHNAALPLYLMEDPQAFFRPLTGIQGLLACDPMPPWFFDALVAYWNGDEDSFSMRRIGEWLARHPATPPDVLWRLCVSINPEARAAAAQRPEVPRERIALLVKAGSRFSLRERSGRRPLVSQEQLEEVARMGYWGAELVASHPRAPRSLLEALALDPRPTIVAEVASNKNTPADLIERLATHPSYIVRRQILFNKATGEAALARLAQSNELDVVRLVVLHPQAPPELLRGFAVNRSLHGTLAAASRTPPDLLGSFVSDPSVYVRMQVAKNPSTPPDALAALAQDPRGEVRLSALLNPALPPEWVERMRSDRSQEVRTRAERRAAKARSRATRRG